MIAQQVTAWPATVTSNAFRECPFPINRIMISERASQWRGGVLARLDYLCKLPLGWDGYKGKPVNFSSATFALNVLESVCTHGAPAPSIVPGTSGDLQIEWHTEHWDVELHVIGPYSVHAWRDAKGILREETLKLTNDFTAVRKWIKEMSEPAFASVTAAA